MTRYETVWEKITRASLSELETEITEAELMLTKQEIEAWKERYKASLYDRGAFETIMMPEAYNGDKQGMIPPLARARLKIMALYQRRNTR